MSASERYAVVDDLPTLDEGDRLVVECEGIWRSFRHVVTVRYGEYWSESYTTHPALGMDVTPPTLLAAEHLRSLIERYGYRIEGR